MAKNTIKIKKYVDIVEEIVAASAITPGYLLELTSAGKVQHHSVAGGNVLPMVALEDELQGEGITDAYAATEPVQVWIPVRGEQGYLSLKNGENVAVGDFLESAGNGQVQKHVKDSADSDDAYVAYTQQIVGVALEAVDMSGSSGVDPTGRIEVRFI